MVYLFRYTSNLISGQQVWIEVMFGSVAFGIKAMLERGISKYHIKTIEI